jgi:hypothetical protein
VADLLVGGELDVVVDRDALMRFLQWVNQWEPAAKARVMGQCDVLRHNCRAKGLWEIVEVPRPEA